MIMVMRKLTCDIESAPKGSQTDGKFLGRVKVGCHENSTWDEATFEKTDECASEVE
jgi:hypothetical protein